MCNLETFWYQQYVLFFITLMLNVHSIQLIVKGDNYTVSKTYIKIGFIWFALNEMAHEEIIILISRTRSWPLIVGRLAHLLAASVKAAKAGRSQGRHRSWGRRGQWTFQLDKLGWMRVHGETWASWKFGKCLWLVQTKWQQGTHYFIERRNNWISILHSVSIGQNSYNWFNTFSKI